MTLKTEWRRPPRVHRNRLHKDDLAPDGVWFKVDWGRFAPGTSAFVPCIDAPECIRQLNDIFHRKGWTAEYRMRIESGRWGVRFWRVL